MGNWNIGSRSGTVCGKHDCASSVHVRPVKILGVFYRGIRHAKRTGGKGGSFREIRHAKRAGIFSGGSYDLASDDMKSRTI